MAFVHYNRTYIIQIQKTINSPIERVYELWQSADERLHWLSPDCTIDIRIDGEFNNNRQTAARFTEVIPYEKWRLMQHLDNQKADTRVLIEFQKIGKWETAIVIRHWNIKSKNDYISLHEFWKSMLTNLYNYVHRGIEYSSAQRRI